jgi:hypothetical protein
MPTCKKIPTKGDDFKIVFKRCESGKRGEDLRTCAKKFANTFRLFRKL